MGLDLGLLYEPNMSQIGLFLEVIRFVILYGKAYYNRSETDRMMFYGCA